MFRLTLIVLTLVIPGIAAAAVGISPSAIQAELASGTVEDGTILFMRDKADSETKMYVNVFSENAFVVTEGAEYFMDVGVSEVTIPYRFDTTTYAPGTYDTVLYIRPERAESRLNGNGVTIQVQGGVRAKMIVTAPEPATWKENARENIRDHLSIYRETIAFYAHATAKNAKRILLHK